MKPKAALLLHTVARVRGSTCFSELVQGSQVQGTSCWRFFPVGRAEDIPWEIQNPDTMRTASLKAIEPEIGHQSTELQNKLFDLGGCNRDATTVLHWCSFLQRSPASVFREAKHCIWGFDIDLI